MIYSICTFNMTIKAERDVHISAVILHYWRFSSKKLIWSFILANRSLNSGWSSQQAQYVDPLLF